MIIRKTKTEVVLKRYGGVIDSKNVEARIGTIPLGTSPHAIPDNIVENLTPKELRELQTILAADQKLILIGKCSQLVADLNDVTSALDSGLLDPDALVDLHKAATRFAKRCRTALPKSAIGTSSKEPS